MNWKLCLSVSAAALLGLVPQNGVSCAGGDADPKDYFTSFFSRKASGADESYRPFYYTLVRTFYDQEELDYDVPPPAPNASLADDWSRYCGNAPKAATETLLFRYSLPTLEAIRQGAISGVLPDSVQGNEAVRYLVSRKDEEALDYLLFAKRSELLTYSPSDWEVPERDSTLLQGMSNRALVLSRSTGNHFLRERYAFQAVKCNFYSGRFEYCIDAYDRYFADAANGPLRAQAISYKAGALYRLNRNKEAAYAFSQAFGATTHNRRGNFLGFLWSTQNADSSLRDAYVAQGRNNREKADLLGLFSLYGEAPAVKGMQQVYRLDPASPLLPLLASREISKLEEQYLSPLMGHQVWSEAPTAMERKKQLTEGRLRAAVLAKTLAGFGADSTLERRAYYAAGAAYLYLLDQQWDASRTQLGVAERSQPSAAQQDQLKMLRLLLAANEPRQLTAKEEEALLPSAKWLVEKARTDAEYRPFLRDFFGEVLHNRYRAQGDAARANLALGFSDLKFMPEGNGAWWAGSGTSYLHDKLDATETQKLYNIMKTPATGWERFLVQNASFNRNTVIESMGTAYLREGNYAKAIEWLEQADSLEKMQGTLYDSDWNAITVNVDPFHDYLNDWQRYEKKLSTAYTKLTFAEKMEELHQRSKVLGSKEEIAKAYYQLGNAYYNMSQYGNAWMAVSWNRGSSDWNEGGYQTAWEKDFFGVYRARDHYALAYKWTSNREFKAACYFMMAKCAQKQLARPAWSSNLSYEEIQRRDAVFLRKFKNNELFPGFVKEFGNTKFYQYTY
ncbi:MAG: hypothetical protein EOO15_19150, partial [Chitinophagaceae bacterium]